MKRFLKGMKWIILLSLLFLSIIFTIIVCLYQTQEEITDVAETEILARESCAGGEFRIISLLKLGDQLWKPISATGEEVYCVEPGTLLRLHDDSYPYKRKEDIERLVAMSGPTGPTECGCSPDVQYYGTLSDTYYKCHGGTASKSGDYGHVTETSTWTGRDGTYYENLYDIGFIASWLPEGQMVGDMWGKAKQQAIWMSQISQKDYNKEGSDGVHEGEALLGYATRYKAFYEQIMEEDPETGKTGMKPKSLIPIEEVRLDIDQEDKIYKLGPFKLDYVDGKRIVGQEEAGYAFSGITDMYLIDDEGNHIDISAFLVNGELRKAYGDDDIVNKENYTFFSYRDEAAGLEENENLIDWYAYQKAAPLPGEEFYIEFKYPGELVGSVKLHVDFRYLVCEMELCFRDGFQYMVDQTHLPHYNPHCHGHRVAVGTDDDGNTVYDIVYCGGCCEDCAGKIPKVGTRNPSQDGVYVAYHNRYYVDESLELLIPPDENFSTTMKIGGKVFEDLPEGKESLTDGVLGEGDINLKNIEVSLYEVTEDGGLELATLATLREENTAATDAQINDPDDYMRRTNPTLTDENGYYEFRGVDVMKKYVIKFTYNGQEYIPTDYLVGGSGTVATSVENGQYSSVTDNEVWKYTSKATEIESERLAYDTSFSHIDSSPNNYRTDNSLQINQYLESADGGLYNEVFHTYELAGFYLDHEGNYQQETDGILVDTYLKLLDGQIIDTSDPQYEGELELTEGIINKTIKEYIRNVYGNNPNHAYPTDMKTQIYQRIAGSDEETWRKLQFIEDCKIDAYTKNQTASSIDSFDMYPVYDYFTTYVKSGNKYPENNYTRGLNSDTLGPSGSYQDGVSVYENNTLTQNGYSDYVVNDTRPTPYYGQWCESKGEIEYKNIYPGQLQINLGLWSRQEFDLALKKDVYKATLKINGRTEIYGYNEREIQTEEEKAELKRLEEEFGKDSEEYQAYQLELENRFWEIQERIIGGNYDSYYGTGYTRELYGADHAYEGTNKLEAYVTYKITIRNQSQSILTKIDEIVDYYDSTYEFMNDMSWIMYDENPTDTDRTSIQVKEQDFYDIMVAGDKSLLNDEVKDHYRDVNAGEGRYANNTKFDAEFAGEGYNTIYIRDLTGEYKMGTGETVYVYLTFKINGEGSELELESATTDPGKQNIVEINGYSTFYADGTTLPNNVTKNSGDVAGLIDRDSKPGNFTVEDLNNRTNNRYEQNFEDDADRARGLTVTVEQELERQISGTVWEDKRAYQPSGTDALVGNGVREDDEVTISGIRVELHEVVDGVPQDEIAEIYDGSTWSPASTTTNESGYYSFEGYIPGDYVVRFIYGGEGNPFYNGQDYKSTSYQYNHNDGTYIDQNGRTDISGEDRFGYLGYTDYNSQNESASFGYSIHKSDEFGENVSDAKDIWDSSYDSISQNDRQSVNDYSSNSYNGVTFELANQLNQNTTANQNTQMIAETGAIRVEFEYNRQSSEGDNTEDNNGYWLGEEGTDPMDYAGDNNINGNYHIQNVDFGLEERPKAQLELNKQISNIRVVLANQNILFDANQAANNLIWEPKAPYNINDYFKTETRIDNEGNRNGGENVYSDYAGYRQLDTDDDQENRRDDYDLFRSWVLGRVETIVSRQNGIIQITMDEEIMHGATIEITYDMTVTNIGEEDYNDTRFYYIGEVSDTNTIVKTSADFVIDYVPNNMQFRTIANDEEWGWETISQSEIGTNGYVDSNLTNVFPYYNTLIVTDALNEELYPLTTNPQGNTQDHTQLILTQNITPQNSQDDMSYDNIAEIVQISNTVGRRMAYSVQGNQDPTTLEPTEPDTSKAERVVILPPFGEQYLYIGLGIFIVAMIGIAAIVIRKVVLNKNRF